MANLEISKYYILDNNDLATDEAYDTLDAAIEAAREIADDMPEYRSTCLYIQRTDEVDGRAELMTADYVIGVNGGESDTGRTDETR